MPRTTIPHVAGISPPRCTTPLALPERTRQPMPTIPTNHQSPEMRPSHEPTRSPDTCTIPLLHPRETPRLSHIPLP
eukprot:5539502-Alexandrium_andersonii.AAC.1